MDDHEIDCKCPECKLLFKIFGPRKNKKEKTGMKIIEMRLEESKQNKGLFVVVATTENGKEFVLSGDHCSPTYAKPQKLIRGPDCGI